MILVGHATTLTKFPYGNKGFIESYHKGIIYSSIDLLF